MSSGISVRISDEVLQAYQSVRHRQNKSVIFQLTKGLDAVFVSETAETDDWENFRRKMLAAGASYGIYNFDYETNDGIKTDMVVLMKWVPLEQTKPWPRMVYAAAFESVKKALAGHGKALEFDDEDQLEEKNVRKAIATR